MGLQSRFTFRFGHPVEETLIEAHELLQTLEL